MNHILVVEDNQDMRGAIKTFFEREGFNVTDVPSTEEGIDAVDENKFDIGLIDINLPGKSGFSMAEYIRETNNDMPLIALTARDSLDDKLKGFEIGFNDYVLKPFNLREVHARIKAQLKHNNNEEVDSFSTKNLTLVPKSLTFTAYGKEIELTQLELRIMEILMKNSGILVELDDVIEYAWGETENIIDPPIRIHIANLRKKLNDSDFSVIKTIPGRGYILND